jgi:hypothetical protein
MTQWVKVGNIQGPPGASAPPGAGVIGDVPSEIPDNTTTIFTLSHSFAPESLAVYVNGLRQRPTTDFVVLNDTQFQLTSAPLVGDSIQADYGAAGVFAEIPIGSIDGLNTLFTAYEDFNPGTLSVFLNGLEQRPDIDFRIVSDNQFELTSPPWAGDSLLTDYYPQ